LANPEKYSIDNEISMYGASDSPKELIEQETLQEEALVGLFLLGTEEATKDSKPAAIKLVDMYNERNPQPKIYLYPCVGRFVVPYSENYSRKHHPDSILGPYGCEIIH